MYYILFFLKSSGPKLVEKCCFEFQVFEKILLNFVIQCFLNTQNHTWVRFNDLDKRDTSVLNLKENHFQIWRKTFLRKLQYLSAYIRKKTSRNCFVRHKEHKETCQLTVTAERLLLAHVWDPPVWTELCPWPSCQAGLPPGLQGGPVSPSPDPGVDLDALTWRQTNPHPRNPEGVIPAQLVFVHQTLTAIRKKNINSVSFWPWSTEMR